MDGNGIETNVNTRKIYTREELRTLKDTVLSKEWPKDLDQNCVNSFGQWDPVKCFDNSARVTEPTKRFYYEKNYRSMEKSKEDISLRPERRRWNDGCQVTGTNKRNDDGHSGYKKSYQNSVPNCGGGDFERARYQRSSCRKSRDMENRGETGKYSSKPERLSRNNSNLDEKRDENNINNSKKNDHDFNNSEPEWFLDGPDDCNDLVELHGIAPNDVTMMQFKMNSSDVNRDNLESKDADNKCNKSEVIKDSSIKSETVNKSDSLNVILNFKVEKKREGSRFQDVFQKEAKNNSANESKEMENFLKAVLSENTAHLDSEKLNNVSKPLPNGVLTVEEIEKNMSTGLKEKSTEVFEQPTLSAILPNAVPTSNSDNSKVVNWLSGLNSSFREAESSEIQNTVNAPPAIKMHHQTGVVFDVKCTLNNTVHKSPLQMAPGSSQMTLLTSETAPKLISQQPIQPPPGLSSLMLNNDFNHTSSNNNHHLTQHLSNKFYSQNPLINQQTQQNSIFKNLSQPNPNSHSIMSHNIPQKNFVPYVMPQNVGNISMMGKLNNGSINKEALSNVLSSTSSAIPGGVPNQYSGLSSTLHYSQQQSMQPITPQHTNFVNYNGPPGLTPTPQANSLSENKQTLMYPTSRPIVKTGNQPPPNSHSQLVDIDRLADINRNYQRNIMSHQLYGNSEYIAKMRAVNHREYNALGTPGINSGGQLPAHQSNSILNWSSGPLANMTGNVGNVGSIGNSNSGHLFSQQQQPHHLLSNHIHQNQTYNIGNVNTTGMSVPLPTSLHFGPKQFPQMQGTSSKVLANLFNVGETSLPPVPRQAKYADQLETENI